MMLPMKEHEPILSIITVCFNEITRITLTCESLVNQTFQDFEWIVIDGGSTDGTLELLKQYAQRMNYFVSEPDRGIYHAMNKGIAQAHGAYLLFLNGGDYLYEAETLSKVFHSRKILEADLFYGDLFFERTTGLKRYAPDSKNYYAMLVEKNFPHPATFIKRALFETYGTYDESLKIAADLEFFLRVFVSNKRRKQHIVEHLPFIVSVFESSDGISSKNLELRRIESNFVKKKHYPAWYLQYYYMNQWLIRQKKRLSDSVKFRFNNIIGRMKTSR